jgi:hypothetical protein
VAGAARRGADAVLARARTRRAHTRGRTRGGTQQRARQRL